MVSNRALAIVSDAPLWIVTELATALADVMFGALGVNAGIIALVVEVGTTLLHQLDATFQSLLVYPSQVAVLLAHGSTRKVMLSKNAV
jgi:hypothetical protein